MTEPFENDAHDYLLNQMETGRRTAFEQELQRNPAASAALKRYADSMAGFACDVAGPETLSAADHQAVVAALARATRTPQAVRRIVRPTRVEWRRLAWPVAAAFLVLLNLIEFQRPLTPSAGRSASTAAERAGRTESVGQDRRTAAVPTPEVEGAEDAGDDAPPAPGAVRAADAAAAREAQRELEHLRANIAALRREQDRLRAEYSAVIRLHEEQRVADRSVNRLATMELVDAATYARGERRGLVTVGRNILSEPGVVTLPDAGALPTVGTTTTQSSPAAYAWSVFDESERQGTLNLYNLPAVTESETIQVWVRPADAAEFQRVAEVPSRFYGSSGTVQYALPESSAPAEIVVTVEPRDTPATEPSGVTVLRGP
ncbi:MAG TPA: hypothetical protein VGD81_16155 [Opitutaceae bacterium]